MDFGEHKVPTSFSFLHDIEYMPNLELMTNQTTWDFLYLIACCYPWNTGPSVVAQQKLQCQQQQQFTSSFRHLFLVWIVFHASPHAQLVSCVRVKRGSSSASNLPRKARSCFRKETNNAPSPEEVGFIRLEERQVAVIVKVSHPATPL